MPTYTVPARPKTDEEYLERIARVIFVSGFKWDIVDGRWPEIRKAFHGFDIEAVARSNPEDFLGKQGMINNRIKISRIVHNAKECRDIIEEYGSMTLWVSQIAETHEKDPVFSPSLAEECKRLFVGVGDKTSGWLAYVFLEGKDEPEEIERNHSQVDT